MIHKNFLILFVAFCCFFCTTHDNKSKLEKIEEIDLSRAYNNEKEEYLSSIADSIIYIPLQTDSNSILGPVRKPWENVKFSADRIFISDGNQLIVYDFLGKFLNKIGRKGNGPQEFFRIDNFALFEKEKQVLIHDMMKRELLVYSFAGAFIRRLKVDFWPTKLASLNNEYIAFGNDKGNREFSDYKTVSVLDKDGYLLSRLINHDLEKEIEKKNEIARWELSCFYQYNDTLSYWEFQYDTIWRIVDKDAAYPAFYINLGANKLPFKYILTENVNKLDDHCRFIYTLRIFETKNFIFFRVAYKKYLKHILYNKKSHNAMCIKHYENGKPFFSFINDIDGGLPFWPEGVMNDGEKIFTLIYGYELLPKLQANKRMNSFRTINPVLEHLASNSSILDNPIIMIIQLKKDDYNHARP